MPQDSGASAYEPLNLPSFVCSWRIAPHRPVDMDVTIFAGVVAAVAAVLAVIFLDAVCVPE